MPGPAADTTNATIALFPLGHVLMPAMPLPLHVFEPRYRELLADVSATDGPTCFGVVSLTRGIEVGTAGVRQEPEFAEVGTLAEVLEVQPYDDGASDLFTVGSRRFRIERVIAGRPYLRAQVHYLPESDGALTPRLRETTAALAVEHAGLLAALTDHSAEPDADADPSTWSYRVAARLPLGTADRQSLLEAPDTATRLALLCSLLRREIALLRLTRTIAVAPGVLRLHIRAN